uniref:Ribonuclease H-like domain-containing protein n=1 Tax=Tanacetum cinerariifolium TaxID=118510 RepID=A0A6L2P9W1_TANCI|nr:ribonuclease H-like domain-containing protein [Tanacetum cinerariifolium]
MYDEYNALVKNGTWLLVPRPAGVNMVRSMWLFKHKFHADGTLSRYKAHLVANGSNQQLGVDFDETFSPVVKPATIRTVLSLAVSRKWPIHQLNIKNAFLNGDLSETVYMHQLPGLVDARFPNYVCRLQRSLYGLKQTPRAWFQCFAGYATRVGFYQSHCDSSLFIYRQGSQVAYLLLYVGDIILTASSTTLLKQLIDSLHRLFLSLRKYALQLLERARMINCNPSRTPVDTESKLGPDGFNRFAVYMHNPREPHLAALKRILRYVQGTLDLGLHLYASYTTSLVGYTDADWAGCPSTCMSTTGYYVFLGDNLLSWPTKRQHTLPRSSAEAEYRGVTNVVAETAWLYNLLRELHSPLSTATHVYCDNVSAVCMSVNPVQHQRKKHIEIDIHFIRDMVTAGQVRILHVPSRYQYVDIFTKGLPSALFKEFRSSLSVRPPLAPTARGRGMEPPRTDFLSFEVHTDDIFFFEPLRHEIKVIVHLRVLRCERMDFVTLCEFLKNTNNYMYKLFMCLPPNQPLQGGLKMIENDNDLAIMYDVWSGEEVTLEMTVNGIRKKYARNMSIEELEA